MKSSHTTTASTANSFLPRPSHKHFQQNMRLKTPSVTIYDVVQKISAQMTQSIVKQVNSTYGLHLVNEENSKFVDMDEAKEYYT